MFVFGRKVVRHEIVFPAIGNCPQPSTARFALEMRDFAGKPRLALFSQGASDFGGSFYFFDVSQLRLLISEAGTLIAILRDGSSSQGVMGHFVWFSCSIGDGGTSILWLPMGEISPVPMDGERLAVLKTSAEQFLDRCRTATLSE